MSFGLTVRWSLVGAPEGVEAQLRAYVPETSEPRFRTLAGLIEKRWQLAEGDFFAGVYVFSSAKVRSAFLQTFRANPSPVSALIGSDPQSLQEWDLVGSVNGPDGPLG